MPLVYGVEHTGTDWRCRRAENIEASYADGMLTVRVAENGETLTLTSPIALPEGKGPFPAVTGMGGPYGSLPAEIFTSRGIAGIPFNFGQVMALTKRRGNEPINRLYPEQTYMGAYCAWPWGVSRLIDGLELAAEDLDIDLERLAVTGCSFAGKMALFSGALDERIALTIAQESGGGGAAAWRVSQTLGNVETLGNTSFAWFREDLRAYANFVHKLPLDHHERRARSLAGCRRCSARRSRPSSTSSCWVWLIRIPMSGFTPTKPSTPSAGINGGDRASRLFLMWSSTGKTSIPLLLPTARMG